MKLICTKACSLFGTSYKPGSIIEVATKEAAGKLIAAGKARISVHELAAHLTNERMTTPTGKSDMVVHRR